MVCGAGPAKGRSYVLFRASPRRARLRAFSKCSGVPLFVHQGEETQMLLVLLVINIKRKGGGTPAGVTMRADMITTLPPDDFPNDARDALAEIAFKSLRDDRVLLTDLLQIAFEARTENNGHAGFPKTCSKLKPLSSPLIRASSLVCRSARISSSDRGSPSKLFTNSRASPARSRVERERTSSIMEGIADFMTNIMAPLDRVSKR